MLDSAVRPNRLPVAQTDSVATVGGDTVRLKKDEIIVWVSLYIERSPRWAPHLPLFPAILDTGHTHNFAIQEQHLVRWAGLRPEGMQLLGHIRRASMEAGTTLHVPDPGSSYHLWTIISDAKLDPGRVLIVNLSILHLGGPTRTTRVSSKSAIIPTFQRRTCVNYRGAKLVSLEALQRLKDTGKIKTMEPLSEAILRRVRAAVPDSHLRLDYADLLIEQGLIEA